MDATVIPDIQPLVLTVEDVGKLLQVSAETVKNLHRVRQLRGRLIGKHLRFRPCDVRQFVDGLGE